ncbi:hypothetical protein JCM10449v2_008001 [Rhodotorula kratochvilovae]
MRRQGSGTVTRRFVVDEHGVEREETREERRARKERERAERAATDAGIVEPGSPERRRRSSRASRMSDGADFSAASLGSPPLPFNSPASIASPSLSSTSAPGPTSSKSVLTIALQRAQSAVLLDSANNFPAAVTAYTQSVRLLREVMARVEEGSRDMERKLSTGGAREGESTEEWERRRARYERKERAKSDEARRLRVIHDTYEDRIRMLVQMGHPAPGFVPSSSALPLAPSLPSTSSSSAVFSTAHTTPDLTLPLSFGTPASSAAPSASPSLASLRIDDRPPPPLEPHPPPPSAAPTPYRPRAPHERERSAASLHIVAPPPDEADDDDAALDGIGAAMLLSPSSPTERGVPALASLPVALAVEEAHLAPPPARPLSYASDSTATATARTPNTATPTPGVPAPIPPLESPSAASASTSAEEDDDEQPLHTALESGPGWPAASSSPVESVPAFPRRPTLASLDMRRGSSTSALSGETLRIGVPAAGAGSAGMARGASAASFSSAAGGAAPLMRRGSSLGLLGAAAAGESPVEIRPRPVRTASLAGIVPPALPGVIAARPPLVNASTAEGTISQRRSARSPVPPDEDGAAPSAGGMRPPELAIRAPSSEVERPYAFPPPAVPADAPAPAPPTKSGGFSASSLPGRLRALSQPGSKRPKLPSLDADAASRPPVPPLLTQHTQGQRSISASHAPSASLSSTSAAISRKGSVPTPTSLNAPQFAQGLGRSNSSSSIGSTASRLSRGAGSPSAAAAETPASATFPSRSAAVSPLLVAAQLPVASGGIYLSAGLPSPPHAGAASSREATLALPSVRRPFHLMRLVAATIPASGAPAAAGGGGGYLSERLFVPAQAWTTSAGTKLVAIETKVRMLDLLSSGLDALDRAGRGLLLVPVGSSSAAGAAREEAARFARELESFEGLAEGIQSTLGKKLGQGVIGVPGGGIAGGGLAPGAQDRDAKQGRKGSTASFSSWSSKLSMSLNRVVANGVSLDSQATYVDAIAKVFRQAQTLDLHLSLLFPSPTDDPADSAYALLPATDRHRLERHLRRASEFFAQAVCRFVLRDVGVLLDKYVKRGGAWLSGE